MKIHTLRWGHEDFLQILYGWAVSQSCNTGSCALARCSSTSICCKRSSRPATMLWFLDIKPPCQKRSWETKMKSCSWNLFENNCQITFWIILGWNGVKCLPFTREETLHPKFKETFCIMLHSYNTIRRVSGISLVRFTRLISHLPFWPLIW